jgi:hypothetical protein
LGIVFDEYNGVYMHGWHVLKLIKFDEYNGVYMHGCVSHNIYISLSRLPLHVFKNWFIFFVHSIRKRCGAMNYWGNLF